MLKVLEKLKRKETPLTVDVIQDEYTDMCSKAFDYVFSGVSEFSPWEIPTGIPSNFSIGLIVGGSGSGKSTMLKEFGEEKIINWSEDKSIVSHFESPDEALNKLSAVGLNSIPSWVKPYRVLSNGEKFRADLAMKISDGAVIDEFTSVVDRNVAKAASTALSKYIKKNDIKNVVISSCHRDIVTWLEPDWIIDTDHGILYDGFFLPDQKSKSIFTNQAKISGPCLKTIII